MALSLDVGLKIDALPNSEKAKPNVAGFGVNPTWWGGLIAT